MGRTLKTKISMLKSKISTMINSRMLEINTKMDTLRIETSGLPTTEVDIRRIEADIRRIEVDIQRIKKSTQTDISLNMGNMIETEIEHLRFSVLEMRIRSLVILTSLLFLRCRRMTETKVQLL